MERAAEGSGSFCTAEVVAGKKAVVETEPGKEEEAARESTDAGASGPTPVVQAVNRKANPAEKQAN
ncbi:MAG TPA: hypothetical protein H9694_07600 [Firmicutes bacterium]|nr:hypothetical protein [Bacillota bacterium]